MHPHRLTVLSAAMTFAMFLAHAASAQATDRMKATAMEKMMPADRASKMRECAATEDQDGGPLALRGRMRLGQRKIEYPNKVSRLLLKSGHCLDLAETEEARCPSQNFYEMLGTSKKF